MSAQEILMWLLSGIVGLFGFVFFLDKSMAALKNFWKSLHDGREQYVDHVIAEREHDDAVAWLQDTQPALARLLEDVSAQGARIEAQVGPNGGSSLHDSVRRIEQAIERIEHAQASHDELHDRMQMEAEERERTAFDVLERLARRGDDGA